MDYMAPFEASLIGRSCVISRREYDWAFDLKDRFSLAVSVPWRIVSQGRIAFASDDHGQLFGLASPVDGEAAARRFLGTKLITRAVLDTETADLTLHFDESTRLDIFNNSSGYEGWQASYVVDNKGASVFALGGGELAFFSK